MSEQGGGFSLTAAGPGGIPWWVIIVIVVVVVVVIVIVATRSSGTGGNNGPVVLPQCRTTNDCPANHHCVNGDCTVIGFTCNSDSNCKAPLPYCDDSTQQCAECTMDGHCGEGMYCFEGVCSECAMDAHCGESQLCNQGTCVDCITDQDCNEFETCVDGTCMQQV